MKTLALAFFVFCVATLCRAANPSLENFDQLYFKTNAPAPGIIQTRMNTNQFRSPVLPGDTWTITNVTGLTGASHWTNVAGVLQPVDGSSVLVTNLTATSNTVNVGTMTWLSKSIVLTNGVNYLPSGKYSQLQLISPSTDPSLVQIVLSNGWNTVQHLEIFNLTNAVPSQGAFTLTNLTPIPDSLGGGVVKLINGENWVATNGCGIELRFISPDWVEQFRSDVSGNPTFISNTFNNITVISNTTLRGRITINNISITTNTLWETNIVAGTTNLQPVDSTVAVTVPNGFFIGGNSLLHYAGMGAADDIVSYKNATNGATEHTITLKSRWDAANITGRFILDGDTNNFSILSSVIGNDGQGYGFQWGVGDSSNTILETKLNNSVVGWSLRPGVADGSTPFQLGTYATHSTGNLFELANNTTNRVVVTPLSTLIGSPVTSPNFSVPAALQVSNFQDRGKALTVDIKLGASGNNDDYPVYFYSQITNSSAHPTINMEEVSPSGYIGGAHTLLSVQETPKVTNTVSTWPTYAAASTTAGYFNAAPTGGTNGAAMGLQGSVDPTRNFINIGVGSYVEATTDNLAATNIAFSGTVNQVLGTQKAVGGLFEIGSLANIPSIPSSAGVLIDGHNSGAPLIIAQTNGAVQMKVNANSGYDGTGNLFLSSDGTYKAAGGGGGSTLWTNLTGGGNVQLLDGGSNIVEYVNANLLNNRIFIIDGGPGPNVMTNVLDLIAIGAYTLQNASLTNDNNGSIDLTAIGDSSLQNAVIHNTLGLNLIGSGTGQNANFDGLTYADLIGYQSGQGANFSFSGTQGGYVSALGYASMNSTVITNGGGDFFAFGDSALAYSVFNSCNDFIGIGDSAILGGSFNNVKETIAIGHNALSAATVTNTTGMIAIGLRAMRNLSGSGLDNTVAIGNDTTVTNANDFTIGNSSHNYKLPGSSMSIAGAVTANSTVQGTVVTATKALQQYQGSLTHSGTVTLDFDGATTRNSITLTGNVTLATSNLATNRTYRLKITGCSTNSTIIFPSWVFIGSAAPSTITATKQSMLSLEAWGANDTNVIAVFAEQP